MSSDVVLTAALRNNLLSLQDTQSLIDRTQLRLATGRKVNSALDNAQSFFAAQGLNNRASDLGRLLDGLGQSIQTIQAADDGITALSQLVQQADSLATQALEATSSASKGTSIVGDVDVSDYVGVAANAGTLTFSFTNQDGGTPTAISAASVTGEVVTIGATDTIDTIINNINAIRDGNNEKMVSASLTDSGRLQITTLNGLSARLELESTGTATVAGSQTLAGLLGFSSQFIAEDQLATNPGTSTALAANLEASSTIKSQALYDTNDTTKVADRSTLLTDLVRDVNQDSTIDDVAFALTLADVDTASVNIAVNGGTATSIAVTATSTIQSLIDDINDNSVLKSRVTASYDETTGRIAFAAKDGGVESLQFSVSATEVGSDSTTSRIEANFGFGSGGNLDSSAVAVSATTESSDTENVFFGSGGGDIAQAQTDFNKVREQIDALVRDSGYRGTNLLNGDDLVTTFNEDRSNQLTTTGTDFTSTGLGITEAAFATASAIESSLTQVRAALSSVRDFGSSIANDLAIIQTREDFTKSLINTLTEGSDKLTVADQNEEGANLLALQTRQTLGVTSLSLASQSQQSVLRLF